MSGSYAGPFGRMLPTSDLPSSEQPPEPPERPANRLESGDNSYQLPPPRPPGTLPFGTDPLLRQRQQAENTEPGRGPTPTESTSQPPRTEQQLPSVRHLLTPVAGPSSPPPLPFHQSYGTPIPSLENRQPSHTLRQHEPGLASQMPSLAVHDKAQGHSESFPQPQTSGGPQTSGLPPLSQMAMHSSGDIKHHTATRSDSSAMPLQHAPLAYYGATYHDQAPSGGISSPESANRSKESTVLPHVIDERYVEGEGVCYVYADGSRVPKAIDGIPVNANWGVTKAGKPRKRLAQACLTCREKKIKCQPNLPKCDQCQKSGRECRFESAPRGSRSSLKGSQAAGLPGKHDAREGFSPGALTASEVSPSLYNLPRASSNSATSLPGTSGQSPISEGPILTPSGTEGTYESRADADRAYRPRTYRVPRPFPGSDHVSPRSPEHFEPNRTPEYADVLSELRETNTDDPLTGSWNIDPYDCDPGTTTHYIESYFSSVNDGLYHMFPHSRFMLWLESSPTKSAEDKMLLYSMMALGSIFSDRHDRFMALRQYSRVARFAIQKSQHTLSLQLAQSHLIMSLLYYATGFQVGAWDSIGAAGRAVSGLRYNVESGGVVEQIQVCDYGLHPQALIECRRRTFWVAFILDRVSSFISASSTFIPSEAALIRLPCREEIYEAQQYATAPYFQSSLNQAPTDDRLSTLSPVAFLIQIISIWGDVSLQVFRLAHTPSDAYARLAEELHSTVTLRTDDWMNRLPEQLAFSAPNLERASQVKKADAFVSNHMFYHATLMKLYRHVRYSSMRPEVLVQYIHRARYHAVETLRIALAVIQYANEVQPPRTSTDLPAPKVACLNPFLCYVILSAIDVLSAAGLIAELPDCIAFIKGALGMVLLLARPWDSSLALVKPIQKRVDLMIACLNDRARTQDKFGFAVDGLSLEAKVHAGTSASQPPGTLEEDLFYGSMPREMLLYAMRIDDVAVSEHSIVWLRDR